MHTIGKKKFNNPPLILAPMEDVTDSSFRRICSNFGADIVFSEFVSVDGIMRKEDHFGHKLNFLPEERPIALQLFGNNPETLASAIKLIEPLQPDYIDLNMGCPVKKIVSKGAGAALIKTPDLMIKLAEAAVKATNIPITVKTRTGWDESSKNIMDIALRIQDTGISALTIHGRTKAQMYQGLADWNIIAEVKNNPNIFIPIIGNGDIDSPEKAIQLQQQSGVDGLMIGRASFGNPFIFRQIKELIEKGEYKTTSLRERVDTCKMHIEYSANWKGHNRTILEVRKHYSGYFKNFTNFKPFKLKLMLAKTKEEVFEILDEVYEFYSKFE